MQNIVEVEKLFHRSRERIRDLGEVFTPDKYVEEMLDLLSKDKNFWADEDYLFFEPCCGHGNIVLAIYRRRLQAIHNKAVGQSINNPHFYAVANALNNLWAIDVDRENVENCRLRVLELTIKFLAEKTTCNNRLKLITRHKNFFAHVLAAIRWHIHENETLSALSPSIEAENQAHKTKAGSVWFNNNGHRPLNFAKTWSLFFTECQQKKTIPVEFKRAEKFVVALARQQKPRHSHFAFAHSIHNYLVDEVAA